MREKIKGFHRRRPYIDPIINIVLGAVMSDSFSTFRTKLQEGNSLYDIRTWFPFVFLIIIAIVYFVFFSVYASGKYKGKEVVIEALNQKTAEAIEKIDFNDADRLFEVAEKWNNCFEKINLP